MLRKLFIDHPASVGKSYPAHLWGAWRYGGRLFAAAIAAFAHGLVPAVFPHTASDIVARLAERDKQKEKVSHGGSRC